MKKTAIIATLTTSLALPVSMLTPGLAASLPVAAATSVDLSRKLENLGSRLRGRINQRRTFGVSASQKATADMVRITMMVIAAGPDVAKATLAVATQKDKLINQAKSSGIKVGGAEVVNLNVRPQYRSYRRLNKTPIGPEQTFKATATITLEIATGDNVLANIAKVAGDGVSQITAINYSYSPEAWDDLRAKLEKRLVMEARRRAKQRFSRFDNAKLGDVVRLNVRFPRPSRYQRHRTRFFTASGRFLVEYKR